MAELTDADLVSCVYGMHTHVRKSMHLTFGQLRDALFLYCLLYKFGKLAYYDTLFAMYIL